MQPAVFLDRDDTLILNDGDLGDPDAVQLVPGVPEGLRALRRAGFRLVVVTNQGGVARGRYTEDDVDLVHRRIAELVDEGAGEVDLLDRFYYCPYHPEAAVPAYRRDHFWRKPRPGMLLQAARDLDLDLGSSWMVGDRPRDVEAGRTAGCRTVLLAASGDAPEDCRPTAVARDFPAAVRHVLKHAGPRPETPPPVARRARSAGATATTATGEVDAGLEAGGAVAVAVPEAPPLAEPVERPAASAPSASRPERAPEPVPSARVRPSTGSDDASPAPASDPASAPASGPAPATDAGGTASASGSTPGVASVSAVSDQTAAELRAAIGELVEEVRTERMRRAEFGGLRLAAGLLQLLAVLFALLAVLQLGPDDAFFRWIAGAGLVQLAVIAVLVADARS